VCRIESQVASIESMKRPKVLPPQHQFAHDYCFYLLDYLADFIGFGERTKSFNITIQFKDSNEADSIKGLEGEFIWKWLEEKGYSDKLGELLLKSLFPALLADFCQFTYEALSCSGRGRLTVAYALLRKPLKENLAYLEWLLGDPQFLLTTLYNEPAAALALGVLTQRDRHMPIIRAAARRTTNSEMYSEEFLYDLRYVKAAYYGFDSLWNKALHLVTTHKDLATEPQNLNFIFSGEEARHDQWDFLYSRLPFLLFYTADICESLMAAILGDLMPDAAERIVRRGLGLVACTAGSTELWKSQDVSHASSADKVQLQLAIPCPKCCNSIGLPTVQIRELFVNGRTRCSSCRRTVRTADMAVKPYAA